MAALTDNRITASKGEVVIHRALMANSTTIFAGSLVMINSSGLAVPAAASAGNKGVIGVALEKKISGTGGADWIKVGVGKFKFAATSIAQTALLSLMYAQDDQTVDETQAANQPIAGMLSEFISATEGWVLVGPQYLT